MRSTRGQATIDYVAVIAVLAILFAVALASAAAGAPGIVNAVAGQIRHALCVVSGGPCPDLTRRPCTVATTRDTRHFALSVILVRVDHDRYVLREEMSDGTVRLTVARSGGLGVEAGVGARAKVTVKGRGVGASDEARGGAQGVLGWGRVYVARDAREAAAVMRAIRDGDDPPVPARERFFEGGVRGLGTLGIGSSVAGASLRGMAGAMLGARRDTRTDDVTLTFHAGRSGLGAATVALGGPMGMIDGSVTLGLTVDRHRRPTELTLSVSGTAAGGMALPPGVGRALGTSAYSADMGGRRWELAARLDLRDPLAAAAWARFRDDPASAEAIRGLGEAIRDRGHLDVRAYRTDSTSDGAAAGVGEGVQLGGEYDHTVESGKLLAARSRPSGGLWEERFDCVAS